MSFLIYKHTSPSGKSYIGLTSKTIEQRLNGHKTSAYTCMSENSFHQAIRKYGIENFTSEILIDNIETLLEATSIEIYYIRFYNTYRNGYNDTKGGRGMNVDYRFFDEEWRKNIALSKTGTKLTQSHKDNIGNSVRGEKNGMYGRTGELSPNYGKSPSEETKNKLRESNVGKTRSDSCKANIKKASLQRDRSTRGKHIQIYNDKNELLHDCLGTFTQICYENNYDMTLFRSSFKTNTQIIHKNYNDWYCIQL